MSWPTKVIAQNRVAELYSSEASPSSHNFRNEPPEHTRVVDTVHISEAAMRKFRESEEARSGGEVTGKDLHDIKDKDFEESLKVLETNSTDLSREGIKKAFINSIKKYHPDMHPTSDSGTKEIAAEKTRKIIEAYRNIEKKVEEESNLKGVE